jgi:hypothetical protein
MLQINRSHMEQNQRKNEVLPGTLSLMVLKTLSTLGPLHGYGIARRVEQISGGRFQLNQGAIYPALLSLEQMVGSAPNGACRKTTGASSITRSPERVGSSLSLRKRTGDEHPK